MSALNRVSKLSFLARRSCISQSQCLHSVRLISTSKKKDDTTTAPAVGQPEQTVQQPKKKYFYDYGFHGKTEDEEYNNMHSMFFFYVSLGLVGSATFFYYRPDTNLNDWAQREAYLELRRREQQGLPLIDPNYADPSTVYLPSDEELGDTEIII